MTLNRGARENNRAAAPSSLSGVGIINQFTEFEDALPDGVYFARQSTDRNWSFETVTTYAESAWADLDRAELAEMAWDSNGAPLLVLQGQKPGAGSSIDRVILARRSQNGSWQQEVIFGGESGNDGNVFEVHELGPGHFIARATDNPGGPGFLAYVLEYQDGVTTFLDPGYDEIGGSNEDSKSPRGLGVSPAGDFYQAYFQVPSNPQFTYKVREADSTVWKDGVFPSPTGIPAGTTTLEQIGFFGGKSYQFLSVRDDEFGEYFFGLVRLSGTGPALVWSIDLSQQEDSWNNTALFCGKAGCFIIKPNTSGTGQPDPIQCIQIYDSSTSTEELLNIDAFEVGIPRFGSGGLTQDKDGRLKLVVAGEVLEAGDLQLQYVFERLDPRI